MKSDGDWWVYILRCADNSLYTGITNDVGSRVARHTAGKGARYTRGRGPFELVYSEWCESKGAALRREAAIKKMSAERKRELIKS